MKLFCLKDVKTGSWMYVCGAPSVDHYRQHIVNDLQVDESHVAQHPEDYEVWCLGEIEINGCVVGEPTFCMTVKSVEMDMIETLFQFYCARVDSLADEYGFEKECD